WDAPPELEINRGVEDRGGVPAVVGGVIVEEILAITDVSRRTIPRLKLKGDLKSPAADDLEQWVIRIPTVGDAERTFCRRFASQEARSQESSRARVVLNLDNELCIGGDRCERDGILENPGL